MSHAVSSPVQLLRIWQNTVKIPFSKEWKDCYAKINTAFNDTYDKNRFDKEGIIEILKFYSNNREECIKSFHLFNHLNVYSNPKVIKETLVAVCNQLINCQTDLINVSKLLCDYHKVCGSDLEKLKSKKNNLCERRRRYRKKKQKEKFHFNRLYYEDDDDHFIDSYIVPKLELL